MDLRKLSSLGWAKVSFSDSNESTLRREMSAAAAELGKPIPARKHDEIFTTLVPVDSRAARPNSLSRKFSRGEFELHNDTAHWVTPCRYIFLGCIDPGAGGRPTFLLDTRRLPLTQGQLDLLRAAPVRITNGRRSFFSTILSRDREFVRFDTGCMSAPTEASLAALRILTKQNWPGVVDEFHWQPGSGLIIDNWRVLHGRGPSASDDCDRRLLRVSIL